MPEANDFNTQIIEEFRANDGIVGGPFEGAPLLLLTTTGARSGQPRVAPMMYRKEGERLYVFASKAGAPTSPDWYHNLVAHPEVTVEAGKERFGAHATVVDRAERDRVYAAHAAEYPGFAEYEAKTDRVIPVVALDRS
ncbi:MAG TPA: nitroreductase family deazaflavin-dependent oxidoreductase [Acidimicrobiales bacterium]|jgi:deazaflavin-dependent oxidoreductase (nitroreductase family)|nr:nitroreductase family deazaflavin-dependent oxidoreductase [Acidimicrobiales bacterium]